MGSFLKRPMSKIKKVVEFILYFLVANSSMQGFDLLCFALISQTQWFINLSIGTQMKVSYSHMFVLSLVEDTMRPKDCGRNVLLGFFLWLSVA